MYFQGFIAVFWTGFFLCPFIGTKRGVKEATPTGHGGVAQLVRALES